MKRLTRCLVLCVGIIAAGHVLAGEETPEERAQQLQRDQALIQALVDGGLQLAAEDDPLCRADYCNKIADNLAREIKQAIQKKDATRATQLSEQMQLLLVHGVAGNLGLARESMGADSPRVPELEKVGADVIGFAKTIEDEIGEHPAPVKDKMLPTLQAVAKGKTEVEKILKGPLPKDKGKGKGKKGKG
jgi:hypothetical protein